MPRIGEFYGITILVFMVTTTRHTSTPDMPAAPQEWLSTSNRLIKEWTEGNHSQP